MPAHDPTLAVTIGDPLGIGPEIVVKALADKDLRAQASFLLFGDDQPLRRAAAAAGIDPFWTTSPTDSPADTPILISPEDAPPPAGDPPAPTAAAGQRSFQYLTAAVDACTRPRAAAALVTAPISKEAWRLAGIHYPGHTEFLADRLRAPRHAMLFVGPTLRVILVTIHIPLREVPAAITSEKVFDAIELGDQACRQLGIPSPRIAVAGLNPHAGEGGLFGDEDDRLIAPAIRRARDSGINATGPHPGDAVFLAAAKGTHDLVVAMYHDQGLIPVKLLDREEAVNMTVGLPIIRTSPAHGTAYDIANRNLARPESMRAAIRLAIHLSDHQRAI